MRLHACIVAAVLAIAGPNVEAAGGGGGGSGGGGAPSVPSKPADPDFDAGVAAWKAHDWAQVVERMGTVIGRDANNADAWNYRAYAYRQLGDLDDAFKHYERALTIDPKHRGAREYLGEAYLQAGRLAQAEEQLAALDRLCWLPCEQYTELKEQVAAYKKAHPQ